MKALRPDNYLDKLAQLTDLQTLQREEHLDLYYDDEAGFSLQSVVPYGWQAPDEHLERLSQVSSRLNVLGRSAAAVGFGIGS